jgi:hypothetical protein
LYVTLINMKTLLAKFAVVQLSHACSIGYNERERIMKLSFVPLVIVSVCLILTLSLLWLHSSPKYHDGSYKYHPQNKKSFQGIASHSEDKVPSHSGVEPSKSSDIGTADQPVHDVPPGDLNNLQPDAKLDDVQLSVPQVEDAPAEPAPAAQEPPLVPEQGHSFEENLHAAEIEARVPTNLLFNESALEALKLAPSAASAELGAPVVAVPATEGQAPVTSAAPVVASPPYHNSWTVERTADGANGVFPQLRVLHNAALHKTIKDARAGADTIQADSTLAFAGASAGEIAESSFEFHTLSRLHRALRTGALCTRTARAVAESSLYLAAQSLLEPSTHGSDAESLQHRVKSIIEYVPGSQEASSTVSFALAAAYPTVTALLLKFPSGSEAQWRESPEYRSRQGWNAYSSECPAERPGSNVFVADGHNNALDSAEHAFDCAQIVPTLDLLVSNLLPFEFEELLGNVLCRCNVTFLPQTLPESAYFAFWDSTNHLLHSVEKAAMDVCAFTYDMDGGSKLTTALRSTHIVVQRNATIFNARQAEAHPTHTDSSTSSTSSSSSRYSSYSYSSMTSATTAVSAVNNDAADAASAALAASKRYLSVGLLSSLHLDARSKHHLWSSVYSYFGSSGGEAALRTANQTVADLLVRGAAVRTAAELVRTTFRRKSRPGLAFASESLSVSSATTPTVVPEAHRSVMSQAEGAPVVASDPAAMPLAAENSSATAIANVVGSGNDTSATPASRRRLYIISQKSSEPTYKRSTYSSSASSRGGQDNLPDEGSALTWEYPDHAPSVQSGHDEYDAVDRDIESTLHALLHSEGSEDWSSRDGNTGYSSSKKYGISTASRQLQRHLHLRESDSYRRWMSALHAAASPSSRSGMGLISSAGLVYVMGRHVSLLSLKLSKMLSTERTARGDAGTGAVGSKRGMLVSLLSDSLSFHSHSLLSSMLALKNNVICRPAWSPALLASLLASPERASLSIIQVDVLVEVIVAIMGSEEGSASSGQSQAGAYPDVETDCKALLLEESIAALLSMAEVSLVEVLTPDHLRGVFVAAGVSSACADLLQLRYSGGAARLLELSLQQLKFGGIAEVQELAVPAPDAAGATGGSVTIFRVGFQHTAVPADAGASAQLETGAKFTQKSSHVGLSLYTALQLGVMEAQKKLLLKMLIDFPLWKLKPSVDVFPWELFIRIAESGATAGQEESAAWSLFYSSADQHGHSTDTGGIDSVSRNHAGYTARLRTDRADISIGVSQRAHSAVSDRVQGRAVWRALEYELTSHSAELANGRFSFVEHDSGYGYVSLRIAKSYPNATVISIERTPNKVAHHVAMLDPLFISNNAVCRKTDSDVTIYKNIYESPELFRFQLLSRSMLDGFIDADSLQDWGAMMGTMLSTALTSFVYAPNSAQVSWAMYLLFAEVFEFEAGSHATRSFFRRIGLPAPFRLLSEIFGGDAGAASDSADGLFFDLNSPNRHPQYPYRDFEKQWVLKNARVRGGNTAIQLSPLAARDKLSDTSKDKVVGGYNIPLVRCDIVNMTRHVHHHYDYAKDGHTRTYTMRIRVNQTLSDLVMSHIGDPSHTVPRATSEGILLSTASHNSIYSGGDAPAADSSDGLLLLPLGYHPDQHSVVGVHLLRDRDSFPIPYTNIYGVTLISALRLGLEGSLRDRLFKDFLKMPLYEDMAPWNVVLMGSVNAIY